MGILEIASVKPCVRILENSVCLTLCRNYGDSVCQALCENSGDSVRQEFVGEGVDSVSKYCLWNLENSTTHYAGSLENNVYKLSLYCMCGSTEHIRITFCEESFQNRV